MDKSLSERLPEEIFIRIHQDIGYASTCWENLDDAGVFDSTRASEIAFDLCHFIADKLEEKDKEIKRLEGKVRFLEAWKDAEGKAYNKLLDTSLRALENG